MLSSTVAAIVATMVCVAAIATPQVRATDDDDSALAAAAVTSPPPTTSSGDDGAFEMPLGLTSPDYPARGWDSYDAFDLDGLTEERVLKVADALATIPEGKFRYVVLDEGWAEHIGRGNRRNGWIIDEYCRPVPNVKTFPGSKGKSFAYLAKYLRERGLSLGIWHMKGIPAEALASDCKIKGSKGKYTAKDVASSSRKRCPWHDTVYEANDNEATRLYYKSIAEMFRDWGVEYVKIDCVFGERDWDEKGMVGFSKALAQVYPAGHMVYSVSPGVNALPHRVDGVAAHLSSYRVTDDLWDHWGPEGAQAPSGINVLSVTKALVNFAPKAGLKGFGGRQVYPDADMLPFGLIRLGGEHMSRIAGASARYVYGLWSITLSPMILGGDMSSLRGLPWLQDLLANRALQEVSTKGTKPRVVEWKEPAVRRPGHSVWLNEHREHPAWRHLGLFPYNTHQDTKAIVRITVPLSKLDLPADTATVVLTDLVEPNSAKITVVVEKSAAAAAKQVVDFDCRSNDANVYLVVPSSAAPSGNKQGDSDDVTVMTVAAGADETAAGNALIAVADETDSPHPAGKSVQHATAVTAAAVPTMTTTTTAGTHSAGDSQNEAQWIPRRATKRPPNRRVSPESGFDVDFVKTPAPGAAVDATEAVMSPANTVAILLLVAAIVGVGARVVSRRMRKARR